MTDTEKFAADPRIDIAGAPTITVGGRKFAIPVLPLRQTRKIVALQAKLANALDQIRAGNGIEEYSLVAVEVVQIGLSRAYPEITVDDVDDMINMDELRAAVRVVTRQTLMYDKGSAAAGEEQAASPSIGTDSSPTS